mmetsp:Transcript_13883/g.47981  ORF Transcript_13883/g.47981 Transcript_13883/m.47981 type:complete len:230 (-) Transcript_13883:1949-2638(-)
MDLRRALICRTRTSSLSQFLLMEASMPAISLSNSDFSALRTPCCSRALLAACLWSESCWITSSSSSWRTWRLSMRAERALSSFFNLAWHSLRLLLQSRSFVSQSALRVTDFSSNSDAASSASKILPSSACMVAARLATSASLLASFSCTSLSFFSTCCLWRTILSLSSMTAFSPSCTMLSSSLCSLSCCDPFFFSSASSSSSWSFSSCFSCRRMKECSSNSLTHSSSAS